jgi:hypothetical protein
VERKLYEQPLKEKALYNELLDENLLLQNNIEKTDLRGLESMSFGPTSMRDVTLPLHARNAKVLQYHRCTCTGTVNARKWQEQ